MALFASLFALVGRFVGRILTTTLGWATVLLFGRVPQDRQVWLAVLTFGSLMWVAAVAGIALPDVGTVLLAAVPRPAWIPEDWVRLAMLATALALPLVLGGVTLLLFDPEDRPRGLGMVTQLARGYALVPALAVTLVVLAVTGVIRKLDALVHRRQDAHVAMIVRPGHYDAIVAMLEETLRAGELVTGRRAGPSVLTVPARMLARIAGRGIGRLVPDRLVELTGPRLVVAVYPSDLAITGGADVVARARGLVTRDVPSRDAWFTTTKEAQAIEDEMAALEPADPEVREAALPALDQRLLDLTIDQDTFEVLYRRRLQLAVAPQLDVRDDTEPEPSSSGQRAWLSLGSAIGLLIAALAAADLALVAAANRAGRRGRGGAR